MKKSTLFGGIFIGLLCIAHVPFVAHAQSAEQLRQQIAQILQEINTLRAQLTQSSVNNSGVSQVVYAQQNTTPSVAQCPSLFFTLKRGNTDSVTNGEVTKLQQFLAQYPQVYPEAEVTGYFGPATERAVQRFQKQFGIVQDGTCAETGFGCLGPQTRDRIRYACNAPNTTSQNFAVTPQSGEVPLKVRVVFEYSGLNCTSYSLDWGDGSPVFSYEAPKNVACTQNDTVHKEVTHSYVIPGTHTATLRVGQGTIASLPIVGTSNITVTSRPHDTTPTCLISPEYGTAPLEVKARFPLGGSLCDGNLTYQVDWGDGSLIDSGVCATQSAHYQEYAHTYSENGTYTVRFTQWHPNARFSDRSCKVVVGSDQVQGSVLLGEDFLQHSVIDAGTYTYEFIARLNALSSCNGGVYTILFGDGTLAEERFSVNACSAFTKRYTHTYPRSGTYTALLVLDGNIIDRVTIEARGGVSNALGSQVASVYSVFEAFITRFFK